MEKNTKDTLLAWKELGKAFQTAFNEKEQKNFFLRNDLLTEKTTRKFNFKLFIKIANEIKEKDFTIDLFKEKDLFDHESNISPDEAKYNFFWGIEQGSIGR